MWRRAFVLGVALAAVGVSAPPAWGAFPGRDGNLVVATASGLELVAPGTGAARSVCASGVLCGHPAQPSFSPSGQAIAFVDTTSHRPVVVAADGSCLWCLLGTPLTSRTGSESAFTGAGLAVTVAGSGLWAVGLTGGGARRHATGPVDDAVWSSRGLGAFVRGGWIWVGRPGHGEFRRLARGRSPSFSPDAARLALAHDGYVWIVRVSRGSERRLVRGAAPAWSPTGQRIAYIAPGAR
jgi:dipeptidyl aminopeptidase/acylaminoacyl peptidase